ncbi:hypothetical protein SAMN06295912_12432 [Sphingomonas laterariae]|uniref:DUF4350 domain-containing protein n=1 Tax=Edaphosphingomonas laterariae TaxID=861865 RepID=A0A239IJJ1_9SPHN|nr:DUF4350 domain-containing protein [Sphingomonas laterariae]SNS92594.1 hypothetical protein SAMN06295912_12432 [Sphingomonas laterariae]
MSADGHNASPFSPRTMLWVAAAGILAFAALLLLGTYAPDLRNGRNGGAHALSTSAVGFRGIADYIDDLPWDIASYFVRQDDQWGDVALLVLTPEAGTDPAEIEKRLKARGESATLIVLPKWRVAPLPDKTAWVQNGGPLPTFAIEQLVRQVPNVAITRSAGGQLRAAGEFPAEGVTGAPAQLQTISGRNIRPLIVDGEGRAVLAEIGDRELYILADPDLLNNQGMRSAETARAAIAMLNWLNSTGAETIDFDLTLNGFGRSPSLLKLAFEPPFLALTIALLGAALLAGIQAIFRFGPPAGEVREIAFGKRALVDNSAALLKLARREHRTGDRYAALTRDAVAQATGAPAHADDAALDAYLDRLASPRFTELAAAARDAADPGALTTAARALYRWRRDVIREG